MKQIGRPLVVASLVALAACSQPAPRPLDEGEWMVDGEASSLSFVSVKSGDIGEAHSFSKLGGSVAAEGTAVLTVDLASVDTGIDIRNERMRDFLFETSTYPEAKVTAQIDPAALASLEIGERKRQPLAATLDLRGLATQLDAEVDVLRAGPDTVVVSSAKPVMLDADALELSGGLAKLQELAGLPSISTAVPVSFSLTFTR